MSAFDQFSIEEAMNLTAVELKDKWSVNLEHWLLMTEDEKKSYLWQIRELPRLLARQIHVCSSRKSEQDINSSDKRVQYTTMQPSPFDAQMEEENRLALERQSSRSLIEAHGRPCYSVEDAPAVYDRHGSETEIMRYWDNRRYLSTPVFQQMERWNDFRSIQEGVRRWFADQFPFFQKIHHDLRQKYGLDGHAQIIEDVDQQSNLDHWLEYQVYEHCSCENIRENLEISKAWSLEMWTKLKDNGLITEDESKREDWREIFDHNRLHARVASLLSNRLDAAKTKLELSKNRQSAARCLPPNVFILKTSWVEYFEVEVRHAKAWLDTLRKEILHHERSEANQLAEPNAELSEPIEEDVDELTELKRDETKAEKALAVSQDLLSAAQLDTFEDCTTRSNMIETLKAEVDFVQAEIDRTRKALRQEREKEIVVMALERTAFYQRTLDNHQVLLKWIEQQRLEILAGLSNNNADNEATQDCSTRSGARKVKGSNRKPKSIRSILAPSTVASSRIHKSNSKNKYGAPNRKLRSSANKAQLSISQSVTKCFEEISLQENERVPDVPQQLCS